MTDRAAFDYTAAGLPIRNPGENLPQLQRRELGFVTPVEPEWPQRDPDDVQHLFDRVAAGIRGI